MIGILLSIIFPGVGQLYFGKKIKGFIMIILAITPLYPIILIWSIWDCINLNEKISVDPIRKKEAIFAIIVFLIIIPLFSFLIFKGSIFVLNSFINKYVKQKSTEKEMFEISKTLDEYFTVKLKYPSTLKTIIKNRPLRTSWMSDEWETEYKYNLINKTNYKIISAGRDRKFETSDDIIIYGQEGSSKKEL